MNTSKHHNTLTVLVTILTAIIVVTTLIPTNSVQALGKLAQNPLTAPAVIYGDSLASGWQDWSWNTTRTLSSSSPTQSGSRSIAFTITQAWGALYLHNTSALSTKGYTHLQFYVHGGSAGGQKLNVIANGNTSKTYLITAKASVWTKVSVPLTSLGSPASLTDIYWQDAAGKAQPKMYIDSISLVDNSTSTSPTATKSATIAPTKSATTAPTKAATPTAVKSATVSPTKTYVPTVVNTPISTTHFNTLPPGSQLPSDAQCAAAVKARPENKRVNATYNATKGNQGIGTDIFNGDDPRANSELAPRVNGNFTGTTDEILQWAACKWGIDEDIVRAQAAKESWWRQSAKGDWTTDSSRCAPGHGIGVDGTAGQCPESFGILQNRYPYEKSSWPGIDRSTAFNADMGYAIWRVCYEGYEGWLNTVDRGSQYGAGDAWGCVGRWYAGRWHTSAAETYISAVKDYLNQRIWEQPSFQEP